MKFPVVLNLGCSMLGSACNPTLDCKPTMTYDRNNALEINQCRDDVLDRNNVRRVKSQGVQLGEMICLSSQPQVQS